MRPFWVTIAPVNEGDEEELNVENGQLTHSWLSWEVNSVPLFRKQAQQCDSVYKFGRKQHTCFSIAKKKKERKENTHTHTQESSPGGHE